MKKNKWLSLALSTLLTIVLLFVLFYNINLEQIITAVQQVGINYIIPAFLFHFMAYLFRTWSFYLLISNKRLSFLELLIIHFKHNFYVHMVPASLGEISFPILLKQKMTINESFSILLISRLTTMILTAILFIIAFFIIFGMNSIFEIKTGKWIYMIILVIIFFLASISFRSRLFRILKKIRFINSILTKIYSFIDKIKDNLLKLKKVTIFVQFFLAILLSILSTALFFLFILKGIYVNLHLFQTLFVSSIGVAFILLPIKSIGGFGTTEGAWTIGLMLLGYSKEISISAGFVVHIFALMNVIILFLIGIVLNLFLKKFSNTPNEKDQDKLINSK